MKQRTHYRLKTWQLSIELVSHVYNVTKQFPRQEIYALTEQMRRSAISIPSNIAEGAARTTAREFLNFLSIARGSLSELETQIIISRRLGYLENNADIEEEINELFLLLNGLMRSVRQKVTA
jgi:four helix bundle protein